MVWLWALSWCNTTCSTWAAKPWRFFHNACMRSRRTVWNTTTHHFLNRKDKFQTFNRIQRAFKCDILKGVLCCIFTNTGHPSNVSYGASLVTVDGVRRWFHCFASFIFRSPTWCIIRTTAPKFTMPSICKCSWNVLVTLSWFQLAKPVNPDGKRTWIADLYAASSSDVAIFCLTQVAMLYFFRVYRF